MESKMIGNKIAEARKKTNISQAQLAGHLFISPQAVGKWERGESMPDITTLNRLAEIVGVDLNYFSENFQSGANEPLISRPDELPSGKQEKKLSWNMSLGNWVDADFSGLKNLHEKFSSSNLQRCRFIGSDMSGLLLKSNHVEHCDFSDSDLSSSQIHSSHVVSDIFKGSSLKETEFSKSHIKGCDFTNADLTGVVFKSCSLEKNTISNAVWSNSSFNASAIADIIFDGTIEDCCFENCGFTRVTFQNAKLINTFFKTNTFIKTKGLKGIRFVNCEADRMTYEFLKNGKADLNGITLVSA